MSFDSNLPSILFMVWLTRNAPCAQNWDRLSTMRPSPAFTWLG